MWENITDEDFEVLDKITPIAQLFDTIADPELVEKHCNLNNLIKKPREMFESISKTLFEVHNHTESVMHEAQGLIERFANEKVPDPVE